MKSHRRGRRYYLNDVPVDQASAQFHAALAEAGALDPTAAETVPLDHAHGRVTAGPVWAKVSSPHYDAAAMDGIAVRSRETVGATETSPLRLQVDDQARWVDTGDPMPDGYDAVIMVENVHEVDGRAVEIDAAAAPYQHVRPLGEDIVATELVLPQGERLRPQDLAACAAAGLTEVAVRSRPSVAVIPTGTELVQSAEDLRPGDIIEFNSLMLAAMIDEWGGTAQRLAAVPDEYEKIKAAVLDALDKHDLVVINAGSSAGSEDYTACVVEDLGRLVTHGVALRPGHPVVLGVVRDKPVLGIPGYPVSASLTCEIFVKPLIERKLGWRSPGREKATATLTRKLLSPMGEDEQVRVRLGRVAGRLIATPLQRGAGVITSLVRADGLVLVPRFSEGVDAGESVEVDLLRSMHEVERTIVAIGSHDVSLDLLGSELRRKGTDVSLASANVGSLGGLMALSRGEAHLAGTHLLDEATGEYNLPFVKRHLKGQDVVVINLVRRVQGLIVQPDNPHSLASLDDLAHDGVTYVNRQHGSGTRVLLDYMLRQSGLSADRVRGYEREEYTHLAVAAAVAGGKADAGMGVLSAARALKMDFVPLADEQYDLVIPRAHYESELLAPLLELVRSVEFRDAVVALGGYDISTMGHVVAEIRPAKT